MPRKNVSDSSDSDEFDVNDAMNQLLRKRPHSPVAQPVASAAEASDAAEMQMDDDDAAAKVRSDSLL